MFFIRKKNVPLSLNRTLKVLLFYCKSVKGRKASNLSVLSGFHLINNLMSVRKDMNVQEFLSPMWASAAPL